MEAFFRIGEESQFKIYWTEFLLTKDNNVFIIFALISAFTIYRVIS